MEGATESTATPEQAWRAWTDVAAWADGDLIQHASVDRPFAVGAVITSQLRGFPASSSTVTRVEAPGLWVNTSAMGELTISYDHVIEATPAGCRLTERATVTGPGADDVTALLAESMAALFAETTARVAQLAEGAR